MCNAWNRSNYKGFNYFADLKKQQDTTYFSYIDCSYSGLRFKVMNPGKPT